MTTCFASSLNTHLLEKLRIDIQKTFLHEFFGEARAQEIRDKIWTFSQGPTEAFKSSLERFMRYQRDCPHHGFTEVQLLKKFYKGIDL